MSVKDVQAAIRKFLATDEPQVLCIRGTWGTGKTYTWDEELKVAVKAGSFPFKQYAKVSLFGLNSIGEIKRALFQERRPTDKIDKELDPKDYKTMYADIKTSGLGLKLLSLWNGDFVEAAIEAASVFSKKHLICFDDLERKGDDLRSMDVLGYISHLRWDKKCKIVLLLNDEQLEDVEDFESYLEKVVDIYLHFEPTAEEIGNIAIKQEDDALGKMVRDRAIALGIRNIRVIWKLLALARNVEPLLKKYDPVVTKNAVSTIVLLGWSHFQPKSAPPIEYLKRMNTYVPNNDDTLDLQWRELLRAYSYTSTDEFDLLLLKGIENGYFDSAEIDRHAAELHHAAERADVQAQMQRIWDSYQFSFTLQAKDILDRFHQCYIENIQFITIGDMANLEWFFRELDDERSEELVDRYIAQNRNTPGAFDYDRLRRFGRELPEAVHQKMESARAGQAPVLPPQELMRALRTRGSDKEIFLPASELPREEYVKALKENEGGALSDVLSGFRQYLNTGGLDPACHIIMDKAGEALRQIAAESQINNLRARGLGLIERLEEQEREEAVRTALTSSGTTAVTQQETKKPPPRQPRKIQRSQEGQ